MADRDIYQEVTDRIIGALENGTAPWVKPWTATTDAGMPRNGSTQREYSGINVFLCWLTAMERGYGSNEWFTFKQAKDAGGNIRKGEKGTLVTFWKELRIKERNELTGEEEQKKIPLLRHFVVFNREQIDGLPESSAAPRATLQDHERHEQADRFVRATGARITEGGNAAFYRPSTDDIQVPPLGAFTDRESFYSTLLHELTHWSGAPTRQARKFGPFGTPDYAREELVAEMGAAFLCARLNIEGQLQHPEYIANWLKVLRSDKKAVFNAASLARKATEYLAGLAGEQAAAEAA